jgi:hypothetical protein
MNPEKHYEKGTQPIVFGTIIALELRKGKWAAACW